MLPSSLPGHGTGVVIRWCHHSQIHCGAFTWSILVLGQPLRSAGRQGFSLCQNPRLCPPPEYSFPLHPLKKDSISKWRSPISATIAFHSASVSQKSLWQGDAGMLFFFVFFSCLLLKVMETDKQMSWSVRKPLQFCTVSLTRHLETELLSWQQISTEVE